MYCGYFDPDSFERWICFNLTKFNIDYFEISLVHHNLLELLSMHYHFTSFHLKGTQNFKISLMTPTQYFIECI